MDVQPGVVDSILGKRARSPPTTTLEQPPAFDSLRPPKRVRDRSPSPRPRRSRRSHRSPVLYLTQPRNPKEGADVGQHGKEFESNMNGESSTGQVLGAVQESHYDGEPEWQLSEQHKYKPTHSSEESLGFSTHAERQDRSISEQALGLQDNAFNSEDSMEFDTRPGVSKPAVSLGNSFTPRPHLPRKPLKPSKAKANLKFCLKEQKSQRVKRENIKRLNHNHPRNLQPVSVINSALLVEQSEEDDAGKGCSSGDPNSLDEGRNKCNLDMGESGTGDNGQLYDGDGSDSSCDTSDQPEECAFLDDIGLQNHAIDGMEDGTGVWVPPVLNTPLNITLMQPSPCPPRRKSKLRKTKVNPKSLLKEQKLRGAKMEEIKRFKHDHQHNRQSISVIHGVEKVHDASNGWSNGDKEEANEEGNGCSDTEGKKDVGSYVGQHRNESDDNRKSQTSQVLGAILDSDESFYCNEEPEWERLVGQYGNESNDNGKSQTQVLGAVLDSEESFHYNGEPELEPSEQHKSKPTHSGEASLVFSTAEGSDCIVSEQSSALQDNTEGTGDNERLSNGDGFDSSGDTSGQPEESAVPNDINPQNQVFNGSIGLLPGIADESDNESDQPDQSAVPNDISPQNQAFKGSLGLLPGIADGSDDEAGQPDQSAVLNDMGSQNQIFNGTPGIPDGSDGESDQPDHSAVPQKMDLPPNSILGKRARCSPTTTLPPSKRVQDHLQSPRLRRSPVLTQSHNLKEGVGGQVGHRGNESNVHGESQTSQVLGAVAVDSDESFYYDGEPEWQPSQQHKHEPTCRGEESPFSSTNVEGLNTSGQRLGLQDNAIDSEDSMAFDAVSEAIKPAVSASRVAHIPHLPKGRFNLRHGKTKAAIKFLLKEQKLQGEKRKEMKRFKHDHQHNQYKGSPSASNNHSGIQLPPAHGPFHRHQPISTLHDLPADHQGNSQPDAGFDAGDKDADNEDTDNEDEDTDNEGPHCFYPEGEDIKQLTHDLQPPISAMHDALPVPREHGTMNKGKLPLVAYDSDDSDAPVSNLSDAMDVDDEDVEERKEEYVYVPDVIQKRDNWRSIYQQLKAKPHMPVNGAAMAVFMEMTAEAHVEGRNSSKSAPPAKRSGSNEAIVRVLNVRRDPLENELRDDVRTLTRMLLNFPEPLQVPSPEQLSRFNRTKNERDGPMIDNLQLDLGHVGVSSFWNKHASRLFAAEFVSQDVYACTDKDIIADAFMVHLLTLQSLYRKQQQEDDVDEAAQIMEYDKKRAKARESRRRYLYKRRQGALKTYSVVPCLQQFLDTIWTKLHPDAMSGDESDVQDGDCRYVVPVLEWRNPDVSEWLRMHDHLYLSTRFTTDNRATPGRFPHSRMYSNRVEAGRRPVTGLPLNFYSPVWLAGLTDLERHMLKIQPAVDLNFPPHILKIAARFQGVKNKDSIPLPRNHPSLNAYEKPASSLHLPAGGAFHPPVPTQQIGGPSRRRFQSQAAAGPSKRR